MELGERLKKVRENLGFNQSEFSEELDDITRGTISNWERENSSPSIKYLTILNQKFNININWLLTGEGNCRIDSVINNNDKIIDKTYNHLKTRLKFIREKMDYNNEYFCKKINTTKGMLKNWETGNTKPSANHLKSILIQFNININWLLTGKGDYFANINPESNNNIILKSRYPSDDANINKDIDKRQNIFSNNINNRNINISNKDSVYNKINIGNDSNSLRKSHVVKKENIQQLLELANLKKEGLITDEEFQLMKQSLLV